MSWFYAEAGQQRGPIADEQFQALVQAGTITAATLVWREGMADWQPYASQQPGPPPVPPLVAPLGYGAGTPQPDAVPATANPAPGPVALQFTGDANEYFKIWIVNLLLTIATLGIYAAWAKVRTKRYFYANTHLLGHAFEYLADPLRIFFGNLIVIVLFLSLNFAQTVSMLAWGILVVVLLIATPWFVIRALTFNARNSAWRGLRFRFRGEYWDAFRMFVLLPLAVPLSLGIAYPWIAKMRREWVVNRHAYGTTNFSFSGDVGEFYRIYLISFLLILPLVICYFALIISFAPMMRPGGGEPSFSPAMGIIFLLFFPAMLLAYGGFFSLRVRLFNYSWNNTRIGLNTFQASMRFWDFVGIQVVNALLTGITFGLMYPWARVRLAQYTAKSLRVIPGDSLDAFVASSQPDVSAVGQAASDIFDLDVGIDFGL